jgi:dipeptidyl aminopeptidase/acylaminoacyl peptidase
MLAALILAAGPLLVRTDAYAFPPYAQAVESTDLEKYNTQAEYEAAVGDARFALRKLRYRSGGLSVVAYLYGPASPAAPRPVVVFNRGSGPRGDVAPEIAAMLHRLAVAGFAVLCPMYRGSDGGEGTDEMGGADLDDLMATAALVRELPGLDPDRLFLYGESRGGMMVFQALREGYPARAAAVFGAFTDFDRLLASDPARYAPIVDPMKKSGQYETWVRRRSALSFVDALRAPLLLMNGGADRGVPPEHAFALAQALGARGRPYALVVFAEERHTIRGEQEERDRQAVRWFRRYLERATGQR